MASETPRIRFLRAAQTVLQGMTGLRPWGGMYVNAPRVERPTTVPPMSVTQYPYLGLVPMGGSLLDRGSHEDDEDLFRFDVYGRIDGTDVIPPVDWADRLNDDCKRTLRQAVTRPNGALCLLADFITFGEEDLGFDEALADFILPCTATLRYDLTAA